MDSSKIQFARVRHTNEVESARWIAQQAVLKLAEITPQSHTQCATLIANELNQVKQQKAQTIENTLNHDELADIANYFKSINK